MSSQEQWFAVYTRPKCEKVVFQSLSEYCHVYLPLMWVRRQWSDRVKKLCVPMLPSYVFALVDANHYTQIYRESKVVTILSRNGKPDPVPQRDIDLIQTIEQARIPFQFTHKKFSFSVGDKIHINTGPLMGVEGYIEKFLNRSKVYIHVPSLQGYFCVEYASLSPDQEALESSLALA